MSSKSIPRNRLYSRLAQEAFKDKSKCRSSHPQRFVVFNRPVVLSRLVVLGSLAVLESFEDPPVSVVLKLCNKRNNICRLNKQRGCSEPEWVVGFRLSK